MSHGVLHRDLLAQVSMITGSFAASSFLFTLMRLLYERLGLDMRFQFLVYSAVRVVKREGGERDRDREGASEGGRARECLDMCFQFLVCFAGSRGGGACGGRDRGNEMQTEAVYVRARVCAACGRAGGVEGN